MDLAPEHGNNKTFLPPATYTLSKAEKISVCKALSELKIPSGYSSNFRNLVSMEELKLFKLKSHDCHILMQHLLPMALRAVLPKHCTWLGKFAYVARFIFVGCTLLKEKAIEVCSEYLLGVDPIGIPLKIRSHHKDVGNLLSVGKVLKADKKYWQQAHHYVLDNTLEVEPYIKEHKKSLIKEHPKKSKI
ncbi:hypothetical protein ACFX2F_046867 [Malus domestica]